MLSPALKTSVLTYGDEAPDGTATSEKRKTSVRRRAAEMADGEEKAEAGPTRPDPKPPRKFARAPPSEPGAGPQFGGRGQAPVLGGGPGKKKSPFRGGPG
jgi:hypothetical protein